MDIKSPSCLRHFIEDTPTQKSLWQRAETPMPQLQHLFTRCCEMREGDLHPGLMPDHYIPPHVLLGRACLWPSCDHKERWGLGWDVYQAFQLPAWSFRAWIQTDPDSGCRGETSWRAQKWALLNVVWWGGVVVDLTTCPSAHRLSGWQPGMSAVLHCPCPCSLREVWNRQLWSDSSFQKCRWERRRKKAIRRAEMSSQIPIFPSARTSKAKIFTVEEIYCACVRPLKSSTASSPL